nr:MULTISPECIES: glycosyltransferase family 4 protein [unclassified Leptolyngbya]
MGGLAASAGRISASLCDLGFAVDVVVWSRQLPAGEVLPPDPELARRPDRPQIYRIGRYRQWDATLPHTLNFLEGLHRQHSYDGVWGHYLFPGGFVAAWFAELHQCLSFVSVRGNDLDRDLFPPGDFARLQWTLERAHHVTAVSADLAHKVKCLTRREDVRVLPNAVDTERFAPPNDAVRVDLSNLRAALGILSNEVVLGFAGELREKKGQSFLLQALTVVRQHYPACLLVIGDVRSSQEADLSLYRMHQPNNADRVIVTGHLPDATAVARHLQLCDVYLQPSLWEGMPNALLEAMACGRCCIASDAGGITDVLKHGKNGFVLPRSHLPQLGEAVLEWLMLDRAIQQQVQQSAREYVLRCHTLERERSHLHDLLTPLL